MVYHFNLEYSSTSEIFGVIFFNLILPGPFLTAFSTHPHITSDISDFFNDIQFFSFGEIPPSAPWTFISLCACFLNWSFTLWHRYNSLSENSTDL